MAGLTDKQQRFCEEYLVDFNASAAYQRAGYSVASSRVAESASSRLLRNVEVQGYLATMRDRISQSAQVTMERTLEEVAHVAFARLSDACQFDADGVMLHDSTRLPNSVNAAVQSVKVQVREGRDGERTVTQSISMHNKMAALGYLCDFFGIRDDFNKARATLKRYGLLLIRDEGSPVGWTIQAAAGSDT